MPFLTMFCSYQDYTLFVPITIPSSVQLRYIPNMVRPWYEGDTNNNRRKYFKIPLNLPYSGKIHDSRYFLTLVNCLIIFAVFD